MSGKNLTNLGEYVQMRLNSNQNVTPTTIYRDYQVFKNKYVFSAQTVLKEILVLAAKTLQKS